MHLPLNALRAFDAAARHLNFTRAANELHVTQTAVSQHIRNLEVLLGKPLFRRLPRGLALTDEGQALWPTLNESFERMRQALAQCQESRPREVLNLGVVGTFAVGWLLPRLAAFQTTHPFVDLRVFTNNNRVDLAGEGLDCAIRFGDGAWHGTHAEPLMSAPLTPMCAPALATRLKHAGDLANAVLLRSYRHDEWSSWFSEQGLTCPPLRGMVFDSSITLAEAAVQGCGVALLPALLFERELHSGRLLRPFEYSLTRGNYWLTYLQSRPDSAARLAFSSWIRQTCVSEGFATT